ncbi:hypothetical protein B0T25DRAFT_587731 [Lasiosphaeria hispida]|uniref:Protein kinase domain-containing protein n=1 Tax=Lasiosphaeria hispida TaxID=260671 RepID=A0AAJ0HX02_9PEZI|nr:hypothetical protein B0T25DRAFT_587731 [Lasiosphaeria hispida]
MCEFIRCVLAEGTIRNHHPIVVHLRVLLNCSDRFLWLLRLLPMPLRNMLYGRNGSYLPRLGQSSPSTTAKRIATLVLSDIEGIGLYEDAAGGLETEHVESMLLESLQALTNLGVAHDDSKLDNYLIVGDSNYGHRF